MSTNSGFIKPIEGGELAALSAMMPTTTPNTSVSMSDTGENGIRSPQENVVISALASSIRNKWTRTELARRSFESRWLDAYRNYRGLYGPDTAFTETERSRVFIKVTKTKVFAAYGQLIDIFFANNTFPVSVEPEKLPGGSSGDYNIETDQNAQQSEDQISAQGDDSQYGFPGDGKDLQPGFVATLQTKVQKFIGKLRGNEKINEGASVSPTAVDINPHKEGAKRIEKQIHDQLKFSEADKHLRKAAFENCLLGTCIIKGPQAATKEIPYWDENGQYQPQKTIYPKIGFTSVWDFYPDPDATTISNCQWTIERHRLTRSQMHELKLRPFFRSNEIDNVLAGGYNYLRLWWEQAIRDLPAVASVERFEVLEFWGMVDKETAKEYGIDEFPEEFETATEVPVNAWLCGNHVIRFVLNPFTPARLPYHVVPHEMQPYNIWGIGVAENMSDTQVLMNGFMRMAVDNAALSGNVIGELDESLLVPGQDWTLYPGKMFRKNAGANQKAVEFLEIPNISQQNMQLFDKARELADEATFPSILSGNTQVNPSLGRTSSGISMMMGSASVVIRNVVKNFDDYLFSPLGEAMYAFNRQFNPSKNSMINVIVKAGGTDSLMRNEILSQRLASVMQMGASPMLAPFIKWPEVIREQFKSLDLDADVLTNTSEEAMRQAMYMRSLMATQGTPNPAEQGQQGSASGSEDQQTANTAQPGNKGFSANNSPAQSQPPQPSQPNAQ